MGTMEKAGIVVVGILILIIVGVGFVSRRGQKGPETGEPKNDTEQQAKEEAGRKSRPGPRLNRADPAEKRGPKRTTLEELQGGEPGKRVDPKPETPPTVSEDEGKSAAGGERIDPAAELRESGVSSTLVGDWPKRHKIVSNDTLEKISKVYYGTITRASSILAANPGVEPTRLQIGRELVVPKPPADPSPPLLGDGGGAARDERPAAARSVKPAAASTVRRPSFISASYLQAYTGQSTSTTVSVAAARGGKTYTVKSGDKLSSIAQSQLGSITYTDELLAANRDLIDDPDRLEVGWVLAIPKVN